MGRRLALLIATYDYQDEGLRRLTAPAHDAESLADVLRNPDVAGFEVTTLINEPHYRVGEAIGDFYRDRRRDDLALLYFTGHGLKDDNGQLYLAMANTRRETLLFTSLPAAQIDQAMSGCMSRQKVLVLDCCYSGAFPAGWAAKADAEVNTLENFHGRGRTVLTASDATQYAFEGDQVTGEAAQSVFTRYLVAGLRDGSADLDGDGDITLDELYSYAYDRVVEAMPQQRPKKQDNVEGRIVIARNVNWSLPAYLTNALASPIAADRLSALDGLNHLYRIGNQVVRARAGEEIERLADDDSKLVSAAAEAKLRSIRPPPPAPPPPAEVARPTPQPAVPTPTPIPASAPAPAASPAPPDVAALPEPAAPHGPPAAVASPPEPAVPAAVKPAPAPEPTASPEPEARALTAPKLESETPRERGIVAAPKVPPLIAPPPEPPVAPKPVVLTMTFWRRRKVLVGAAVVLLLAAIGTTWALTRDSSDSGSSDSGAAIPRPVRYLAISPDGAELYVANVYENNVVVVDLKHNAAISDPIPVGSKPSGIVVSPTGRWVYVTNQSSNSVSVIDTDTRTTVGEPIAVGSAPSGMALSPDGRRLYVTNYGSSSVSVIDTQARATIGDPFTNVGTGPTSAATSPDGRFVYVANSGSKTVSIFDTKTVSHSVGAWLTLGGAPTAIAASPDGHRLYVTSATGYAVSAIDTDAREVIGDPTSVSGGPAGLAVSPDGDRLYVTQSSGTDLLAIDTTSSPMAVTTIAIGDYASGITIGKDRRVVYVATATGIAVIDAKSQTVTLRVNLSSGSAPASTPAPGASASSNGTDGAGSAGDQASEGPSPT